MRTALTICCESFRSKVFRRGSLYLCRSRGYTWGKIHRGKTENRRTTTYSQEPCQRLYRWRGSCWSGGSCFLAFPDEFFGLGGGGGSRVRRWISAGRQKSGSASLPLFWWSPKFSDSGGRRLAGWARGMPAASSLAGRVRSPRLGRAMKKAAVLHRRFFHCGRGTRNLTRWCLQIPARPPVARGTLPPGNQVGSSRMRSKRKQEPCQRLYRWRGSCICLRVCPKGSNVSSEPQATCQRLYRWRGACCERWDWWSSRVVTSGRD